MKLTRLRNRIVDPTSCSPPHKWRGVRSGVGEPPATSPLTPLRSWSGKPLATRQVAAPMFILIAGAVAAWLLLYPLEAFARVGGGGSYSGGGHGGSSGGGGDGGAIIGIVRLLVWLTVEYPAVGV